MTSLLMLRFSGVWFVFSCPETWQPFLTILLEHKIDAHLTFSVKLFSIHIQENILCMFIINTEMLNTFKMTYIWKM